MSVDSKKSSFDCNEIFGMYQKDELPFAYTEGGQIENSEKDLKCWFLENPINKDLMKSMTLRFGANVEKEFIIVIKSPSFRQQFNIVSFINIKMADMNRFAKDDQPEIQKHIKKKTSADSSHIEEKLVTKQAPKELRVMLIGRLENPRIQCLKELYHQPTDSMLIPLCVKISVPVQKFRIPFRNLSS